VERKENGSIDIKYSKDLNIKTITYQEYGNMIIEAVFDELRRAEQKFPGWPLDVVHDAAIVAEEAGELVKASLDYHYARYGKTDEMIKEALQVTAMGLRFLLGMYNKGKECEEKVNGGIVSEKKEENG